MGETPGQLSGHSYEERGPVTADTETATDQWWAARAASKPEAFEVLYRRYFDKVYRYLLRQVGSREDADDLTSQVFLKAFAAIRSYRPTLPFSSWLFRIARNVAIDHLRRRKHQPLSEDVGDLQAAQDTEDVAMRDEALRTLSRHLRDLTAQQRDVIALRFFAGLSIHETAKALGKSEGAVKARLHRGIAQLREAMKLGRQGI